MPFTETLRNPVKGEEPSPEDPQRMWTHNAFGQQYVLGWAAGHEFRPDRKLGVSGLGFRACSVKRDLE